MRNAQAETIEKLNDAEQNSASYEADVEYWKSRYSKTKKAQTETIKKLNDDAEQNSTSYEADIQKWQFSYHEMYDKHAALETQQQLQAESIKKLNDEAQQRETRHEEDIANWRASCKDLTAKNRALAKHRGVVGSVCSECQDDILKKDATITKQDATIMKLEAELKEARKGRQEWIAETSQRV